MTNRFCRTSLLLVFLLGIVAFVRVDAALAQAQPSQPTPSFNILPQIQVGQDDEEYALPIQLILLMTVLSLAPAIVIMTTAERKPLSSKKLSKELSLQNHNTTPQSKSNPTKR